MVYKSQFWFEVFNLLKKPQIMCSPYTIEMGILQFVVAVALAAYKLRRPVRVSLDRNTDMHMVGGRSPMRTRNKVGFKKTGKITALKVDVLIEGGWHPDLSPLLTRAVETSIKKYNVGSFDATFTIFKTNNIPKGAVRAPGDVQGSAIADTVQDHVAAFLGMSGNKVREENLHSHQSMTLLYGERTVGDANAFTLDSIWNQLKARTKLIEREKEVDRFNEQKQVVEARSGDGHLRAWVLRCSQEGHCQHFSRWFHCCGDGGSGGGARVAHESETSDCILSNFSLHKGETKQKIHNQGCKYFYSVNPELPKHPKMRLSISNVWELSI